MEKNMTRCKHCRAIAPLRKNRCSVCGILPGVKARDLSPDEKSARFHARTIRLVAMIHLILAGAALVGMSCLPEKFPLLILAVINAGIAVGLSRYSLWAYKGATVYYFLIGMVNVISIQHGGVHVLGILLALIALYLVGNKTAKAIFERRLPEMI
jgi:hypothetical protein